MGSLLASFSLQSRGDPLEPPRQTGRLRVTSCLRLPGHAIGKLLFLGEADRIGECVLMFADWLCGATITLGERFPPRGELER